MPKLAAEDLKKWIESGPRADDCKPWWNLVFTPHLKPIFATEEVVLDALFDGKQQVKAGLVRVQIGTEPSGRLKEREGLLTDDAIYNLRQIFFQQVQAKDPQIDTDYNEADLQTARKLK